MNIKTLFSTTIALVFICSLQEVFAARGNGRRAAREVGQVRGRGNRSRFNSQSGLRSRQLLRDGHGPNQDGRGPRGTLIGPRSDCRRP